MSAVLSRIVTRLSDKQWGHSNGALPEPSDLCDGLAFGDVTDAITVELHSFKTRLLELAANFDEHEGEWHCAKDLREFIEGCGL